MVRMVITSLEMVKWMIWTGISTKLQSLHRNHLTCRCSVACICLEFLGIVSWPKFLLCLLCSPGGRHALLLPKANLQLPVLCGSLWCSPGLVGMLYTAWKIKLKCWGSTSYSLVSDFLSCFSNVQMFCYHVPKHSFNLFLYSTPGHIPSRLSNRSHSSNSRITSVSKHLLMVFGT